MSKQSFAIRTSGLTKTYPPKQGWRRVQRGGGTQAVRGIDLTVRNGEMFGLLGPNGAGKTTLVKMLCTLILPSGGSAEIAGYPLKQEQAIKREVGLVVTDERSFYWRLSARQNLMFFAAMHGMFGAEATRRVDETLDAVQLLDRSESIFSGFSTGMKQRMAIARGLLHKPKILFLDEPTRSLDPISTNNLHDLINNIRAERQMTVMLITHDLAEAEKMCDRVGVMHKGKLRGLGTADELRGMLQPFTDYTIEVDTISAELQQRLLTIPSVKLTDKQIVCRNKDGDAVLQDVLTLVNNAGSIVTHIDSAEASLETVFTLLTQPTDDAA